jgi:hypothetical protein
MKARVLLALACGLGTFVATATPAFAVQPVVVVDTDRPEVAPAASTTFLAWTVYPRTPGKVNIRAQEIGGNTSFRVNPPGTVAESGGIDGSTLIYDVNFGDLAMLDLATQTELDVPDGVNTNAAEFSPRISGSHLLFAREIRYPSIVLFDTSTSTSQVLYSRRERPRREFVVVPGQVNGNYAVWQRTVYSNSGEQIRNDVFLYDIAAATTTKIPNADTERPHQYGPSVEADGTMFFGRSSNACGKNAQLISRELDGTETVLYEFQPNRDFVHSVAVDNANNTTDVYFDRGSWTSCLGSASGDIVKLPGV